MGLLIRFIIIVFIIYLFYRGIRYLTNPKRKLDIAYAEEKYFFYDEVNNVRKNFFLSYKGAMFEGEKYLDTADDSSEVISIFVWIKDETKLQNFTKADFHYLSSKILSNYPKADISWKNPIEQLMEP
ncbi:sigma-w pathway protein ysdB [Sporosarcina sp. ANT_H38]|uniref:sigma-w pathway protein ysdB n=1 Tax=Sporosarcina sp. ANT_H38 TaxID=2597358 RepID=UPI0011F12DBE|nr:sigma-w pathway protein ysdB [Sporosarcina sp. ANT_H38]KAA0965186.1 sigma-w pathway protein ysdB [Sporosarcina sp. ANT_H38]